MGSTGNRRVVRPHSKTKNRPMNSMLIGPQPHINRLKKFICDNLDKQNKELAGSLGSQ